MKKNTLFTKTFLNLGFILITALGIAQTQTITTTGAGTFTVPAGVTSITVEAWGGGGRGGSRSGSAGASGAGGGGAYAKSTISVTPSAIINLNVGAGSTTNAAGGNTWFTNATTLLAVGGNSVDNNINTGAAGGLASSSIGTLVFSGGNGSNGVTGTGGGGGGSSAGTAANGTSVINSTVGATAPVGGGNGGNGKAGPSGGAGSAGSLPGGGGGGAFTSGSGTQSGGAGGNGKIIITWVAPATYCTPTYTNGPGTIDQITNVTLGTLNNTSGASSSPYYTFYNAVIIPNLVQSSTASISITFGSDGTQFAAVWIDFNQNGTFETGEGAISGNAGSNGTAIINIPVPAGAILGNTRMRVRGGDDVALTTGQSCAASNSGYGETEDYIVNVIASTPPTITSLGSASGCSGTSITINGTNLTGAIASGVTIGGTAVSSITSNSGTVLVAVIGSGTTGTVSVTTGSGTATSAATFTVNTVPAQPSTITGNATPCSGTSQAYSVTNVSGVTYNWTFPAGWSQTAGGTTNSITVTTNGTAGNVIVTPSNSCGNGTARVLAVTPISTPSQPSTITGSAAPCGSSSQSYSVTNVSGTSYAWTFPAGWTQTAGGTTNSITVTTNGTSGTISVTPSNACGTGTARTLAVTISNLPTQPSTITGNTNVCTGSSQIYSVTNVPGVTYNWLFPSGWTQTAGGTTNSITVTVGATSGNVQVTPNNSCGNGTAQTLATTVTSAPTITGTVPGSRTGAGTVDLSATASAGTISWFANVTGGSALGTGNNFTTPGIIITTTYYVETTNGSCTSTPRVAVVATVNFPEITVLGNGNIIMDEDITPIPTDYTNLGSTGVGVGLTRTYTINNSGTVALTIGTITIGGLHASEFVVTTAPAASIAAGASTTFSIQFTPTVLGTRNANVSFTTNDPDENPFNFDISGVGSTGLIPEINVTGNGTTIIDGDTGAETADHTDFTTVTIPGTVVRTFTIQNTGTGPLVLTGTPLVLITGSPYFTVSAQPSSNTIAAGSSLTFQVTYNPLLTGSSVAIVSINNDDVDENVYDFTIIGAAVVTGSEIDIQGNDVSIVDGDTTPSTTDQTDFGITDAVTPIALTYNVFSAGSVALNFSPTTIAITGPNAGMFSATSVPSSLNPGRVESFVITFTPSAVLGVKTATITIMSNDSNEATYNFDIKAEVQSLPALTVAPGGITSNLKFWLKADSNIGITSDNTSIVSWEDKTYGGTKNAVSKFAREPKFQNNTTYNVNFNPVIHFNGSSVMTGGQGFNNADMFIVVKPTNSVTYTASPMDVYCGDDVTVNKPSQDVTGFETGNTSSRHSQELIAYNQAANTAFGVAEISTTKIYTGANIFNPRKNATFPTIKMDILHNGNTLSTASVLDGTYKDIVNTRYWLGRSEFFDASYDGDILEIINYDTRNSDTDKRKIETYLAIKYGITLGTNGTSLDYLNSDGSVIYEAGAGFNYNIAGIGRDDKSVLNQKQSKTENTNSDITIGLDNIFDTNSNNTNAFDVDKKFLVWGHNNNTLNAQVPILVDMSTGITAGGALSSMVDFISIARTWRVKETGGDVPSVKVSIPSSVLTATITPPGDFLMFISDSPVFNPTAEYRIMRVNGSKLEADYDFTGTKYITFGYAPERTYVRSISFDGINDYMDAGKVLNLNSSFTVSSWVKRNSTNKTILSKRNSAFTTGYDLSINSAGKAEMSWINGTKQTITSSVVIPSGIWHNVAVTYNGATAKLYIDGILDVSKAMLTVPANTQSFLVAAADGLTPTSFFNGGIDEVRVWNVALTDKQLRYVMNQEISRDATLTGGTTIPNSITLNDIKVIPWVNLSAYYPMSTYTFTNAKDVSSNNYTAALRNLTTVDRQTAPLPYESNANGSWQTAATWLNNSVQDLPNSLSIVDGVTPVNWNIIKTSHNITSSGNKTVLGLMVNSQTLTASSDTKIEVTNYLKLDGKIDLVGMSQLVQTLNSDLDVTSSGSIERDQQGQANLYNYNYWCSPVSPINAIANNTNYTVAGVMKDGTSTTPANINWIAGYNALISTPISIARYWLYKFDNYANSYSNWVKITENSSLRVGQGFTMKGSGNTGTQNYTFVGKPNNGLINSNTVLSDQLVLIGNPYPSAMDADAFITDNAGSIDRATDGTLYFWEHYTTNNTHVLKDYQGGYGVKNLVGGVAPVSTGVDFISGTGTTSKSSPKRYIPVGQGFFVNGKIGSGGTIIFNNNQRAFFKETDATNSNSLYKQRPSAAKPAIKDHWNNNSNDIAPKDTYKKVRLGFNSSNNYHRQVLLGFMNEKATSEMDYGYDAISLDEIPNDMYFLNGENQLVILGEGYFDENASYPIGIKTAIEGKVTFTIDALENIDGEQKIYIYDSENKIYNEIQKNPYEVNMPVGVNNSRFSLRFKDQSLPADKTLSVVENDTDSDGIKIAHIQNNNTLKITNNSKETTVEKVTLFNINGQTIASWKIENQDQQNIQIQINSISTGVYVAKLKTTTGELSQKLIIK